MGVYNQWYEIPTYIISITTCPDKLYKFFRKMTCTASVPNVHTDTRTALINIPNTTIHKITNSKTNQDQNKPRPPNGSISGR